ncbi:MAG: GAF domain-containing protein [Chloroflexi bacterium]|nr:MAG: GAF domain-containing protein [Chloroflexota bacterium]
MLDTTSTFETVIAEHLAPGRPSVMNIKISVANNPALQVVLNSGKPIAIPDVKTHAVTAPAYDILSARGTVSLLIVPIQVKGKVVGSMGIDAITSRNFTEREINMAQIVAEELGRALETSQLYEQLRSHAADLEVKVDKRTQELKRANERLQELDKLKSKLVTDVSHELRTPLTALSMYLKLLERGKPERRNDYMKILHSQARRLNQLVEDILDLSRLEMTREREFGMEMVDLNEIVDQVVIAHLPRAESESLTLKFTPNKDLPSIFGERNQIAQIVTNLITKYF